MLIRGALGALGTTGFEKLPNVSGLIDIIKLFLFVFMGN
jgi:hypothetical protein